MRSLEYEYAVLEWNELLHQYGITGDAVPRRAFIAQLEAKVAEIDSHKRANIFGQNYKKWEKNDRDWGTGAPVAVILLHDADGTFGHKIAEYWVLQEQMSEEESQKYANFILDRKNSLV